MEIAFTRSVDRRDVTVVTRNDRVRLSVPVFGKLKPIPHDLAHYVAERELGLPTGLWGSVANGALFEGMRVLEGRQPPHARERSHQIQVANHSAILLSELLVEAALHAVQGTPPPDLYLLGELDAIRPRDKAERLVLLEQLRLATEEMCERWRAIPMGGTLTVEWPTHHQRRARRAS